MDRRAVIGVLGTVEILAPVHLTVRSHRKRAVLAGLALGGARPVTIERLVDLVWGGAPPRTAQHALQVYVSELRAQLGAVGAGLVTTSNGYRLDRGVLTTDIALVDELAGAGRAAAIVGRFDEAARLFADALTRWRGEPFEGIDDADEVLAERARLEALRAGLRDELADTYLALGRHAELIPQLESRVHTEPLHERAYEQLMLALYRAGRQGEALRVYQRGRETLIEQVGVEPGHRMRRLEAAVLAQDASVFEVATPASGVAGSSQPSPFVGRDAELGTLAEHARRVQTECAARVVLIGGEPGIGKTRLTGETTDRLRRDGWTVLHGRCPDEGGAPPLWPIADALRNVDTHDLGDSIDVEALAPLRRLLDGDAAPTTGGHVEGISSFALHDALAGLLASIASHPTVLVIDDVHWADEATFGTLVRLAQQQPAAPLFVLLPHRTADLDRTHAFDRALARLTRASCVTGLAIGPLDAGAEVAYLDALGLGLSAEETSLIRSRSDGNPLFLTELARLVHDQGRPSTSVPPALKSILDARLALLGEHTVVLERAAVIGREFDVGVLARVSQGTAESISRALAAAAGAALVDQQSASTWRFSHALVTEVAIDRLDDVERRQLHLDIAEVLESSVVGDRTRRVAEVARHRLAALPVGDAVLAAEACMRTGDDAVASFAYDDATAMFEAAREALAYGEPDTALRARALVGQAEAMSAAGDSDGARPLLDEAFELIDRHADPVLFALAVRVHGLHRPSAAANGDERWAALLRDAIDGLGDDCGWLGVQLRIELAMLGYRTDTDGSCEAQARQALAIATSGGDALSRTFALTGLHQAIWRPDTLDERERIAAESIASARLLDVAWHESMAYAFSAADAWERGEFGAVERSLAAATDLAARGRRPRFEWIARSWTALLDLYRGDVEAAEGGFAEALAVWGTAPNPDAVQCFLSQQLTIRLLSGDVGDVVGPLTEAMATDPSPTFAQSLLSYPLALTGATEQANRALDRVMAAGVDALPRDLTHHLALAMLSEAASLLGRVDVAEAVVPPLQPFADRRIVVNVFGGGGICWGSVAHQLGVCAATVGDPDGAGEWLRLALDHHQADGSAPFEARTKTALAELG